MAKEYKRLDEVTNEPVLDHEYDGIEELDNPLPGWWLATFYGAIVFAAFYIVWHNVYGDSQLHWAKYMKQRQAVEAKATAREAASEAALDPEALAKELSNADLASAGKAIYDGKCSACHALDGGGLVGPNLTDNAWINGDGSAVPVYKVIRDGINAKGMPPWGPILSEDELKQVSAYVLALKGTTPASPKEPQGEQY